MNTQTKSPNGNFVTIKPKREKVNRSKSESIIIWTVFALLVIYAFTLIFPFFFILLNSMKQTSEYWKNSFALPMSFEPFVNNYSFVFTEFEINGMGLPLMFINSVVLSVSQTFVSIALACMAAYVLAKYQFKGNSFIYTFTIIASVAPTVAAAPATYKLMAVTFGFVGNNYFYNLLGMLFMVGAFGGPFLYLHSFFKAIPWSYGESAQLDGASHFRIFLQIMVPLASNGIMTFAIIIFLGRWNEYWANYLYFQNYPTIAVGIALLSKRNGKDVEKFATMVVSIIPVLAMYAIFQKQLMRNTVGGGLKG